MHKRAAAWILTDGMCKDLNPSSHALSPRLKKILALTEQSSLRSSKHQQREVTMIEYGRKVLEQQPFSRLLGAELAHLEVGRVELHVQLRAEHQQQHGFAHGGVVSYCADNALTFAGGAALGKPVVTSEFKINYVRPAIGEKLVARAEALHSGKTQAVCCCKVFVVKDGEERLCAIAQGTIVVLNTQKV